MGRGACGVRCNRLKGDQRLNSLIVPKEGGTILTAYERGYGKRTAVSEFATKDRGTQGVIAMVVNDRNGPMVGAVQVFDEDEVMLISDQGTLVRTHVNQVSVLGRNTQGVTLIRVNDKEKLIGVAPIYDDEDDAAEAGEDE